MWYARNRTERMAGRDHFGGARLLILDGRDGQVWGTWLRNTCLGPWKVYMSREAVLCAV